MNYIAEAIKHVPKKEPLISFVEKISYDETEVLFTVATPNMEALHEMPLGSLVASYVKYSYDKYLGGFIINEANIEQSVMESIQSKAVSYYTQLLRKFKKLKHPTNSVAHKQFRSMIINSRSPLGLFLQEWMLNVLNNSITLNDDAERAFYCKITNESKNNK